MNFANDSLHTTLCLQYDPKDIATTCIYLAGQFHRVKTVQDDSWVALMSETIDAPTLVDIALQLLEPLAAKKRDDQKAAIAQVRKQLESIQETPATEPPPTKRPRM